MQIGKSVVHWSERQERINFGLAIRHNGAVVVCGNGPEPNHHPHETRTLSRDIRRSGLDICSAPDSKQFLSELIRQTTNIRCQSFKVLRSGPVFWPWNPPAAPADPSEKTLSFSNISPSIIRTRFEPRNSTSWLFSLMVTVWEGCQTNGELVKRWPTCYSLHHHYLGV